METIDAILTLCVIAVVLIAVVATFVFPPVIFALAGAAYYGYEQYIK